MTLTYWRFTTISTAALAGLLIFSWTGVAQTRGGAPPRPTTGAGPYKAVMEMDAGLPDHTVYRPEDMSALSGGTLPLVIWGNGACANAGNSFSNFLTDISSYGFLAIALGPNREAEEGRKKLRNEIELWKGRSVEPPKSAGFPHSHSSNNGSLYIRPETPKPPAGNINPKGGPN